MLTGDSRTTAEAVARKLEIDEVVAEVLPDQKVEVVKRFQDDGRIVAMAGDGINDAPALAQAHVGIAMGTGTDVAMKSADVTLVKGDLRGIVRARSLSRATMRNIKQNLFFAFIYNTLGVPIAAGVLYPFFGILLSPMIAAAAMSFSSVSVIANAVKATTDQFRSARITRIRLMCNQCNLWPINRFPEATNIRPSASSVTKRSSRSDRRTSRSVVPLLTFTPASPLPSRFFRSV